MISVVIPARNAVHTIAATLNSLAPGRSIIGEILLIDDNSEDGTGRAAEEAAREHFLPLTIIRGDFGGAGAARNVGLDRARWRYVYHIDADDEVIGDGLGRLYRALQSDRNAKIAVGATVRRTHGRPDKTKTPRSYAVDKRQNAREYVLNQRLPIAMGSGLIEAAEVGDVRFPTAISLDEDTCYWARLLTRLPVATVNDPVLLYNLNEPRMTERFISSPRKALLTISREYDRLSGSGIGRDVLQWRKAWVALRIARLLIKARRYREADRIMRAVNAHPAFRSRWKATQYRARIKSGLATQAVGALRPSPSSPRHPGYQRAPQRTLILTADPAMPPVSGADLRNWQNARAAAELGEVLLASVLPLQESPQWEGRIRAVALAKAAEPRTWSVNPWRGRTELRISRAALSRLKDLVREFAPDTIIVEGIPLYALLRRLRPLTRQLILDMHNVESDLAGQLAQAGSRPLSILPAAAREPARLRRLERRALSVVDRAWVCSVADRERLHSLFGPDIPVDVVPNGVPRFGELPDSMPPVADREDGWPVVLFVGHLGYPPNIGAAERLARSIMPAIRKTLPSAKLILAGRHPKPEVLGLASLPGVEVVGNPEDLSGLFHRSHISAVPIVAGGGTRIKIVEAMSRGLPVVATAIAAEGQGFTDGDDILIADTDEEVAGRIVELCSSLERFELLRRRAFDTVRARFGPAAINRAFRRALGLAGDTGPSGKAGAR